MADLCSVNCVARLAMMATHWERHAAMFAEGSPWAGVVAAARGLDVVVVDAATTGCAALPEPLDEGGTGGGDMTGGTAPVVSMASLLAA